MSAPTDSYVRSGLVTKVIDGDTINIDIDLGCKVVSRQTVRLLGYNAAEKHSKDPAEKQISAKTVDLLSAKIAGKQVTVQTVRLKGDLYDRLLATIWVGDENVNESMLASGLVVPYDGKGARPATDWKTVLEALSGEAT